MVLDSLTSLPLFEMGSRSYVAFGKTTEWLWSN